MAKVYSYLRFSRPEQMRGDSQRRQLEKARAWAARNKLTLDETLDLKDQGVSAFRGKNVREGALALFLNAVKDGHVKPGDYLVLENLDRLSRDDVLLKALPIVQGIIAEGVSIVTLDPERVYSPLTVKDIGPLIEMLLSLFLANEESRKKAERVSQAWASKRARAGTHKLTARCPQWLRLADNRGTFELIPDRVEVVRRIFRMAADGAGYVAITKRLNADGVPTFGNGKRVGQHWRPSSVKKVLASRAVLGEYQPHRMRDGKRVPTGDPLPEYFPPVVPEADFYAARAGKGLRAGRGGRNGAKVTNLFTGLLKDARDGSSLVLVEKGNGPCLVSSAARDGDTAGGAVYMSFPYPPLEQALLVWGYDLSLDAVVPRKATDVEDRLHKAEGRVADLEARLAKVKAKLKTAGDLDALLDAAVELEAERAAAKAEVERLRAEQAAPEADAVGGLKRLIGEVKRAKGGALYSLRLRLRQLLARVVQDIVVLVVQVNRDRVALLDVKLKTGARRRVTVFPPSRIVELPEGLADQDVRDWRNWPKPLRATRFEAADSVAREMAELERQGLTRGAIADRLGVSVSQVSRTLLRTGARKRARKRSDSPWLMSWHPAGGGWTKTHKGKRYFVGLGTLAAAHPKLVTARTAEGSWQAANAWWESKKPR